MQKITPFLWFDNQAEEAVNFYASIFTDAKIGTISRYPEGTPNPAGTVMVVEFELFGEKYLAMNGGPHFKFNPSVSFMINCEAQEEVDYYWEKLLEGGGEPTACGWLTDKYGLSWQITPSMLIPCYNQGTPEQASRVMQAMMQMVKLDIPTLKKAFDGD
jgi:predicted 3-demethylubiquinone-9 3-methyltransferase (glyoxalase superfamily)